MEKLDHNRIKWKGKKDCLYRGTSQRNFERIILESLIRENKTSYFGYECRGENITYACSDPFTGIFYILHRDPHYSSEPFDGKKPEEWPFTNHPILLEINTKNLRDKLYLPEEEGIVIKGSIDLEDINIIFSSRINRIGDLKFRSYAGEDTTEDRRVELKKGVEKYGYLGKDLLDYFEEDLDARDVISLIGFGIRLMGYSESEKNKIRQFIEIMKGKMLPNS